MKKIKIFFIFFVTPVFANNLHITILNSNQFSIYPQYSLEEYGIIEHRYFSIVPEFFDSLKKSKLLYIGQTSNPDIIFENPQYIKAIEEFLKNGGTIWFESFTFHRTATNKWWKSIGISLPVQDTSNQGIIVGIPATDVNHSVLKSPYQISAKFGCKGHFCWRNWTEDFVAPFRLKGDPAGATMLIKENVLEKGRIIFNSMWALATTDYAGNGFYGEGQRLLINILSYCYDQTITETKIVPLFKRFQTKQSLALWKKNPYFPLAGCPVDASDNWKIDSIYLKACVNEVISFVFCLTAMEKSDSFEIQIQTSDLKFDNEKIPSSKIKVLELQFFKDFSGRWIYDPMPQIEKIIVHPGETRQIWISINTFDVKPGNYSGEIVLNYNKKQQKIPVNLIVWPVELQKGNPLFFCAWDYVPNEGRTKLIGSWENWKNYHEDLLSHGVNVFPVMSFNHPYVKCDKDGNIIEPLNYNLFDQEFYIKEKGYIYLISTPRVYGAPSHIKYPSKEYDTMLRQWVKEIISHLKKDLGLDYDKFAFYPWDELSSNNDIPNALNEYKIIKEVDSKARIFLTVGGSGKVHFDRLKPVVPYIDIWCPHISFYMYFITGAHKSVIDFMKSTGAMVWSYENTGRWKIKDDNYVSFRLKPVGAYRAGVGGYGFWAYNVWKGNPWEVFDENKNVKSGAGTESLAVVYSGPEPVTTPRWEGLREGMNDVKYFEALKNEIKKAKENNVEDKIIKDAESMIEIALKEITEKIENPDLPILWREKIIETILKLREASQKQKK